VIKGLPELAHDIRSAGAKVALATNQQDYRMEFMAQSLNYSEYFDCCFYSCALGAKKPSAAFFEKALQELGLRAEQCLFVDDSAVNVAGARKVGLRAELFQFQSIEAGADELRALLKAHLPNLT
jgi:putative hydrolase of the HAD superfamily